MAGVEGIEPPTYGFGDRHSNLIELHPYIVYIVQHIYDNFNGAAVSNRCFMKIFCRTLPRNNECNLSYV